jgi:DNA ligase-1
MRFADLVETSLRVGQTRSRLDKVEQLADFVRRLIAADGRDPNDLTIGVAYLCGDLPQGRIGVGYALLGRLRAAGAAAAATLTLAEIDRVLSAIQAEAGAGSAQRRNDLMAGLLARSTAEEQEFLVRLVIGEIRQGALEGVLVEAVARAFAVEPAAVRKAVMLAGGLPPVAAALAEAGRAGLDRFALSLFRPVQPMLADTAADVGVALDRLGEAAFEYKMDGARVHVHKDGDRIEVFSRAGNRVTAAVPEIVARVQELPARRLLLDGEAIAFGPDGRPLPFQTTMRRFGRKSESADLRLQLPLSVYFFDLLRVDDDTLIDRPLTDRWAALTAATEDRDRVPRIFPASPEAALAFANQALAAGHEGVMAKGLASVYSAGRRGMEWLKIKQVHTLDLVVLAAEWGSGRRRGWLSNLHLGARDPASGGFVMLGKTFKGLTDELLRWQTEALLAREIGRDGHVVHVRPELVAEIAFNDVQVSPQYPGGVALRFARVKRYRSDKTASEADTIDRVRGFLPGSIAG